MTLFHWILLGFLLVPLTEIYLLLNIGAIIGALPTVFLVVFTAVLGAYLMRAQGFSTLARIQSSLDHGEVPAGALLEGAFILFAGALLLTPGFVTDAVGFGFLAPPVRRLIVAYILKRGLLRTSMRGQTSTTQDGRVIEGDYRREDD